MKVDRLGRGRQTQDEEMKTLVVAKVCPGQTSIVLDAQGRVSLNTLVEIAMDDVYGTTTREDVITALGVLAYYHRAHWAQLEGQTIYPVTKGEMRALQEAAPR